jgi:hypothetical protein
MFRRLNKMAQSTAEFAIVISIVIGAIVAMQIYVKRALQARVRDASDGLGSGQYEPYYLQQNTNQNSTGNETDTLQTGGSVARGSTDQSQSNRQTTYTYGGN